MVTALRPGNRHAPASPTSHLFLGGLRAELHTVLCTRLGVEGGGSTSQLYLCIATVFWCNLLVAVFGSQEWSGKIMLQCSLLVLNFLSCYL